MITAEEARALLDYDPETGDLSWVNPPRYKRCLRGHVVRGKDQAGYYRFMLAGQRYFVHRVAWLITYGEWPLAEIDHINGDKRDNRLTNLREASRNINAQNLRSCPRHNRSCGLLGATYNKARNKWIAQIQVNKQRKKLGEFDTPEEAHAAYLKAKRELHEGCTI